MAIDYVFEDLNEYDINDFTKFIKSKFNSENPAHYFNLLPNDLKWAVRRFGLTTITKNRLNIYFNKIQ